jgi:septal ring factor EnvC (AmiA/AmiB activator)
MQKLFLLIAIVFFSAAPLLAGEKDDYERLKKDIAGKQEQENNLKRQLNKTEDELRDLRSNLVKAAREQRESEDTLLNMQNRLDELERQQTDQRAALARQYGNISDVLVALLRLSRTPAEILLIRPDTPLDALRSAMLMRHALPFYAEKAQTLNDKLSKLDETRVAILDKRQALLEAQKTFGAKQEKLNALLTERRGWLKATESQRSDVTRQIKELSSQASSLQDLMSKVAASAMKFKARPGKASGKLAFIVPVKGRVVYGFGDNDEVGSDSRGLMLKVKAGEMIVSPGDGQVVFAGPFKGYGNILILRHGDDYHSFLAGFGRMDVAVGQVVNAGEPLGRAATEAGPTVQLYYELRLKGSPVDPMRHFHKTSVAANKDSSSSSSP